MNYTPQIIGNQPVQQYLQNQLKNGTVPHASLWVGPVHVGKTTLLTNIIFSLLCQRLSKTGEACLQCQSCTMLEHSAHPNVSVLEPNEKSKIPIDTVRALIRDLHQTSFLPGKRVVVIQQADALQHGASNALLKVLEEPGQDTIFFLLTENANSLLSTIQSRCAIVEFNRVSNAELHKAWPEAGSLVALADGLPGKLKQLMMETGPQIQAEIEHWLDILEEPTFTTRAQLANLVWPDAISRPKAVQQTHVIESLSRDILLTQHGVTDGLYNRFLQDRIQAFGQQATTIASLQALTYVQALRIKLQQPTQLKLLLTDLLLTLYR